jgi:hypothetical protein
MRILANGGRVDKYSGNYIYKDFLIIFIFILEGGIKSGPYRVWMKSQNYPGLAMSRSVGDLVASSIGVTCDPGIFIS